jgi:ribosome-associated translation inhibitor RaiA
MSVVSNHHGLPVEFDLHSCELAPAERARMEASIEGLRDLVAPFPVTGLHVLIERNNRSNDFSVKTSLLLVNQQLVASEHHAQTFTAFERCVDKLVREVEALEDRLSDTEDRRKIADGTRHELLADYTPDFGGLDKAVEEGDYAAFRTAMLPYEEPLRKRIGRWIERIPAVNGKGRRFTIADVVESVLLDAFEKYLRRPTDMVFHEWLENLIDPAVQALVRHPDRERENASMARSAAGLPPSREEN